MACPGGVATLEVGSGDGGGEGGEHVKIVADEGGVEVGEEGGLGESALVGGGVGQGGGRADFEACEGRVNEGPDLGGADAAHGGDDPREEAVAGCGRARGMFVDLLGGLLLEGPFGITASGGDVCMEEGPDDGEVDEGGGRLGEGAVEAEVGCAFGGGGGGEGVVESRDAVMPVRSLRWEKATVARASWRVVRRWWT